jgi:hypothetical protein
MKAMDERRIVASGIALPPDHVVSIVSSRCSMCHAAEPVWEGIQIAPKGVMLDNPASIALQKDAIRMHSVLTHAMPPNNLTGMTLDERRQVAVWLRGGVRGLFEEGLHPSQHVIHDIIRQLLGEFCTSCFQIQSAELMAENNTCCVGSCT